MVSRLTVSAWAATVGISKQAGYKAVARCQIPIVDGTVDPEIATLLYHKRTRARQNQRRAEGAVAAAPAVMAPEGDTYWTSRARREAAEAEIAERRLEEMCGELTCTAAVRSEVSRRLTGAREALLQLPSRVVPLLLAKPDQAQMHEVLRNEIVGVLEQLVEAS